MGDYIKVYRSILDWEWFHDLNTFRVFVYMIIKANWKDGKFEGKIIKRGSLVSSFNNLSIETDLTVREVRTAISHLKTTSEVTSKSYSKYTVFTVVNYDLYQSSDKQNDIQVTSNRHSNDILTTTIEEVKKGSKKEEKNKEVKKVPNGTKESRFAPPTPDEVNKYCSERNNKIDAERFVDFYSSKGWMVGKNKMKDWKAAVRTWENKEKENRVDGRTGTNPKPNAKSLTELAIEAGIGDTPFEGF